MRGFRTETRSGVEVGTQLKFSLNPLPSISGVVVGPLGQPIRGAVVLLDVRGENRVSPARVESDAKGQFEFPGLRAGKYRVLAHVLGFAPSKPEPVAVSEGEVRVRLQLRRGFRVAGRAVDLNKRPLLARGSLVELDGAVPPPALVKILRLEPKAASTFVLSDIPSGEHTLLLVPRGHAPTQVRLRVRDRDLELGDIAVESGAFINGRVRSGHGVPVPDCEVSARLGESLLARELSEPDGSFLLGGLRPGEYSVEARCNEATAIQKAMAGGDRGDGVTLVLRSAGRVVGEVVDELGQSVTAFTVALGVQGPPTLGVPEPVEGRDGRFSMENVSEGVYSVWITASGFEGSRRSTVRVTSGRSTDVGRIQLGRGFVLKGTVVGSLGTAISGAEVSAVRGWGGSLGDPRSVTDDRGSFELTGLTGGLVDVVARHPDWANGRVAGVEVGEDGSAPPVEIVLAAGGTLDGRLSRPSGRDPSGVIIVVRCLTTCASPPGEAWRVPVDADGAFVLEHLPAGSFIVSSHHRPDPTAPADGPGATVQIVEGETTRVDLADRELLVTGRVTRAALPLPNARVFLSPADVLPTPPPMGAAFFRSLEPQRRVAMTGPDGSFALLLDSPGSYVADVAAVDGKWTLASRRVEIADAPTQALDLDFRGTRLAGRVIDRSTQEAVSGARVSAVALQSTGPVSSPPLGLTDTDGRFELLAGPGRYRLRAVAQGQGEATAVVDVTEGEPADQLLEISRGKVFRGRVVDPSGRPLAGMSLGAVRATDGALCGTVVTGEDGIFEFTGPSDSPCSLLGGHASSTPSWFVFQPSIQPADSTSPPIEYGAVLGVRVRINVRDEAGAGIPGARVYVLHIDGVAVFPVLGQTYTDNDGGAQLFAPGGLLELRIDKGGRGQVVRLEVRQGDDPPILLVTLPGAGPTQ